MFKGSGRPVNLCYCTQGQKEKNIYSIVMFHSRGKDILNTYIYTLVKVYLDLLQYNEFLKVCEVRWKNLILQHYISVIFVPLAMPLYD